MKACLFLVLFLFGCAPVIDEEQTLSTTDSLPLAILSSSSSVDVSKGLKLEGLAKDKAVSFENIEQNLFLIQNPTDENIFLDEHSGHSLVVKRTKQKNKFLLQSTEQLNIGDQYGIYYREPSLHKLSLLYAFIAQAGPPRLTKHPQDKGLRSIHHERILFRFVFDQPVRLHDDNAITLVSLDENVDLPIIENLIVEADQKTISLRLKNNGKFFEIGKKYAFLFNSGLTNSNGQKTNEPPWEFIIVDEPYELKQSLTNSFLVSTSSNSAEFKWLVKNFHDMQFFAEDEEGAFVSLLDFNSISFEKNLSRWFLSGLKDNTTYRFIARGESFTGELIHARGLMKTASQEPWRISEIMVNPASPGSDARGEYIEVVNISINSIALDELYLAIEDKKTAKTSDCAILASPSLLVDQGGHFLIVGSQFSKEIYDLEDNLPVIRLKQKTLCGGLSNEQEKIIKLHRRDGHFIDRYGGHLWGAPLGQSVQRINPKGLDEAHNYCYQKPSPGKINGPCEPSLKRFKSGGT